MIATKSKAWMWAGIYLAVSAVGAAIWVYRSHGALAAEREVAEELQKEVAGLQEIADQRDDLELQLAQLTDCVGRFVRILPVPEIATEEKLLELVQKHCDTSGVRLTNVIQGSKSRSRKPRGKRDRKRTFEEVPIKLDLRGTSKEFIALVNLLERNKSLIRVNSFTLSPPTAELIFDGTEPLKIQLEVSTFRYEA